MKSLQAAAPTFAEKKIQVIGVSMDTVEDQKSFSDKFRLTFPLLADTDGKICDAFKVVHPDNKPSRETFLFRDGKLVHHFKKVDAANQAEELLEKIAELSR